MVLLLEKNKKVEFVIWIVGFVTSLGCELLRLGSGSFVLESASEFDEVCIEKYEK